MILSEFLPGELNILTDCCPEEREEGNKINAGFGLRQPRVQIQSQTRRGSVIF